jgi:hypothetical protein
LRPGARSLAEQVEREHLAPAAADPCQVVGGDPPDPGHERALAAEAAEVGHDDDQDLLRRVLGVRRMAEHAQREPVHRVLHRLDQGAHRAAITGRGRAYLRCQVICVGRVNLETSAPGSVIGQPSSRWASPG